MSSEERYRPLVQALTIARALTQEPWQTVYTLADRHDLSVRTVLRYLAALRAAGITVESRQAAEGRSLEYRIPKRAWRL